jgi:hypothetical protein
MRSDVRNGKAGHIKNGEPPRYAGARRLSLPPGKESEEGGLCHPGQLPYARGQAAR